LGVLEHHLTGYLSDDKISWRLDRRAYFAGGDDSSLHIFLIAELLLGVLF